MEIDATSLKTQILGTYKKYSYSLWRKQMLMKSLKTLSIYKALEITKFFCEQII